MLRQEALYLQWLACKLSTPINEGQLWYMTEKLINEIMYPKQLNAAVSAPLYGDLLLSFLTILRKGAYLWFFFKGSFTYHLER